MNKYPTNEDRTSEYLSKFNRKKILKYLIKKKSPLIFDIGANDGLSLEEFKSWWGSSIVHCFEPQEECWGKLESRSVLSPKPNAVINKIAVGDSNKQNIKFYSHDINTGISGFSKINISSVVSIHLYKLKRSSDKLEDYYNKINHERFVDIIRLDDYMDKSDIHHIDLLKIDTQGHEVEVLSGLGYKLADVDVVVTELMFYDYYKRNLSFSDIESYLLPAGFKLYDISHISKNPMNGRTDWVDVIYVNNRLR